MSSFDIAQWRAALGGLTAFFLFAIPPIIGGLIIMAGVLLMIHSWRTYYGPGQWPWRISLGHLLGGLAMVFIGAVFIWASIWGG